MPSNVRSFTETILLNKHVLDCIYPSKCEPHKISQIGNSAIETLVRATKNPLSSNFKNNDYSLLTTPLRSIAKVAFVTFVTLTVSPVGAMYFGCKTVISLTKFTFEVCSKNGNKHETLNEVKKYAKLFFTDLFCFGFGVGVSAISCTLSIGTVSLIFSGGVATGIIPVSILANKIFLCGLCGALSGFQLLFQNLVLGTYDLSHGLSDLLRYSDNGAGKYISLEMRHQLGLVDQNGDLLKYSSADQIQFNAQHGIYGITYRFHGPAEELFRSHICHTELKLLDQVGKANGWLEKNHFRRVNFRYPFKGNDVAKILESAYLIHRDDECLEIIKDLRKIDFIIKQLRNIYHTAQKISADNNDLIIPATPSFVDRNYYQRYFDGLGNSNHIESVIKSPLNKFYDSYTSELSSLNPDSSDEPEGAYEAFLYRLRVGKWELENNDSPFELHELIGLERDYTLDQVNSACRKIQAAVHPDKHLNNQHEATILFKIIIAIKENLSR